LIKKNISKNEIIINEKKHFSSQDYIWQWSITGAGQIRYDNRFANFIRMCNSAKNSSILEIGCGDGEFTKRLLSTESTIFASDINFDVIQRANNSITKIRPENLCFKMDDAESLSFGDNSLNIVCGISILHHLDYKKGLKEAYRVLKKGGEIFFTEPNLLNPITISYLNIPWLRKKIGASPNETALLRWEVERCLEDIGFKEIRVMNYDFLFPGTPDSMIGIIDRVGSVLAKVPFIKEISGSLLIYAKK
jgi:ubiquinone/menaquinone biosynthesis C-methylase UbiE